jgi:hypothetical protein
LKGVWRITGIAFPVCGYLERGLNEDVEVFSQWKEFHTPGKA